MRSLIQLVGGILDFFVGKFAVAIILFQYLTGSKTFQHSHTVLGEHFSSLATASMAEPIFFQPLAFFNFHTFSASACFFE